MNVTTGTSCEAELRALAAQTIRMGGLAEAQVADAVEAVARRDVSLAQALIVRDLRLDRYQAEIEDRALKLIARHSPGEADLRRALSSFKLAMNLERCGDLARNIAKRSLVLSAAEPAPKLTSAVERLGRLVAARLREVLDAWSAQQVGPALGVWRRDGEVDEHYESLFRELLEHMGEGPQAVASGAHLLFIAKNLERIGDHATNIAEVLHYQITGEQIGAERPKLSLPEAAAPQEALG